MITHSLKQLQPIWWTGLFFLMLGFVSCTLSKKSGREATTSENGLIHLDKTEKEISGEKDSLYVLDKIDRTILDKTWMLIALNRKELQIGGERIREPQMTLKAADNRVNGSGNCNLFTGTYHLLADGGIQFSRVAATKMLCQNMEEEDLFFEVLGKANHYLIQGDTLMLTVDNLTLAKFINEKPH